MRSVARSRWLLDMAATLGSRGSAAGGRDPGVRRHRWACRRSRPTRPIQPGEPGPAPVAAAPVPGRGDVFPMGEARRPGGRPCALFQPGDSQIRERGRRPARRCDRAIACFAVSSIGDRTTLGENLEVPRLARMPLADRRADVSPPGSGERRARRRPRRSSPCNSPATEFLGLAGYRTPAPGRPRRASRGDSRPLPPRSFDEAVKAAKPAPPEQDLCDSPGSRFQIGQKYQFEQAVPDGRHGSHLDAPMKGLWKVRIHLAELPQMSEGADRSCILSDLFREIQELARRQVVGGERWALLNGWHGAGSRSRTVRNRRRTGTRWRRRTRRPATSPKGRLGGDARRGPEPRRRGRPRPRPDTGSAAGPTTFQGASSPRADAAASRKWSTTPAPAPSTLPGPACSGPWPAVRASRRTCPAVDRVV